MTANLLTPTQTPAFRLVLFRLRTALSTLSVKLQSQHAVLNLEVAHTIPGQPIAKLKLHQHVGKAEYIAKTGMALPLDQSQLSHAR